MQLVSRSLSDTIKIGRKLAHGLRRGDIICLSGQLGSGKTVLTKGIAEGIGFKKEAVVSPTFVIIRQYDKGKLPLYHFDLYRLRSPEDIQSLGYEEYFFGEGVTVVEWSDKLKHLMPKEYLSIEVEIKTETDRCLHLKAFGRRYEELLKETR